LEDVVIEERIILKGISSNRMGGCRLDLSWSGMEHEYGRYEQGNGPLSSKNFGESDGSTNRL
jgi:hypothetical protein